MLKYKVGDRVYNKIHKDWGVMKDVDTRTPNPKYQPYCIQYNQGYLRWDGSEEENLTPEKNGGEKEVVTFNKGDRVRIMKTGYGITMLDSEGIVSGINRNGEVDVDFYKLTGGSRISNGTFYSVEPQYLEKIEVPTFQIGDRVKVLRPPQNCNGPNRPSCCDKYIGKVGTIDGFDNNRQGTVSVRGFPNMMRWCSGFTPDCLSLEKEGGEKMEKIIFKVGDEVEVVSSSHGWGEPKVRPGDIGTINGIQQDGTFAVDFPNHKDWTGETRCFVHVKPEKPTTEQRNKMKKKVKKIDGKVIVERDFYPELKMCYDLNHYAVVVGETGTGKSFAVEYLAKKLGVPFTRVSFDLATPIRELLGTLKLVREKDATITQFARGILLNALLKPGIILGDELNSADPAKMFLLHQITDTRKIYIKEQGESYEMHPECRFFATINPSNRRYTGTLKLNLALVNRFHILSAPPFTREELDVIIPRFRYKEELLKFYHEIRKLITKQQPPFEFSVRNVQRIIDIYRAGMGLKTALEIGFLNQALCFGEKQDYDACVQIAMTVFGKEVMGTKRGWSDK